MSETTKQITKSPLHEQHVQLVADMIERAGWLVPGSYGDALREYEAVREGSAGLLDLSARGRIRIAGSEAVQFLNGLITNDMKTLGENRWMPAAFPNVQGRLIAAVRVIRVDDKQHGPTFIMDTEPETHARVMQTIERYTLAGDFHVTDVTTDTALLSLQGKQAAELLSTTFGMDVDTTPDGVQVIERNDTEILAIRATHTGEDGLDLLVESWKAVAVWESLIRSSAEPVGFNALEILRIEAGIPRYGVDMDESLVVSETNLDDAVSFTKGCYVGQEIIARIKYRGHVAKKITGVIFDERIDLEPGTVVTASDDKEIGRVTSVTYSPRLRSTIALALLKYQYLAAGTAVNVVAGGKKLEGRVTDLPFVKGSWPQS
jgi:folate-binding protein YgfZ